MGTNQVTEVGWVDLIVSPRQRRAVLVALGDRRPYMRRIGLGPTLGGRPGVMPMHIAAGSSKLGRSHRYHLAGTNAEYLAEEERRVRPQSPPPMDPKPNHDTCRLAVTPRVRSCSFVVVRLAPRHSRRPF